MQPGTSSQLRLLLVVIGAVLTLPFLLIGAYRTMDGMHTSAVNWLDPDDPVRARYDKFRETFESNHFVLMSWEGCTLDDDRLRTLQAVLTNDAHSAETPLIARVSSGQSVVEELTQGDLSLRRQEAIDRLQGVLIGPGGELTCLLIVLTEEGADHRAELYDYLLQTAEKAAGLAREQLHFAGPPIDTLAIDQASNHSVLYFAPPSVLLSFFVCWWFLRSLRFTTAILAVASFGELMVLGALHYVGVRMDAVLIVLPPLVFVLTVSAGIHLINYYFDQVRAGAGADAARLAMLAGWAPCALAAFTTAIGLGSLLVSEIVPVRTFGASAAVAILVSVALMFLALPGVMQRWPLTPDELKVGTRTRAAALRLARAANSISRYAVPLTVIGLLLMVACGVGLTRLRTSIGITNLFPPGSRVVRDFDWIEQNVTPLVPLEVVLHIPTDEAVPILHELIAVRQIQAALVELEDVDGVMSVATFCPDVPMSRRSSAAVRRANINAALEDNKERLIDSHFLAETDDARLWRISARVSGVADLDYNALLAKLQQTVGPQIKAVNESGLITSEITDTYTGAMPLVFTAQHALLRDMFYSLLLAFVLIWLVMSYLLTDSSLTKPPSLAKLRKGLWLGVLAMLPNLFPIVVVFGVMGWLNWPADIGSTMTACVALGIAVDDTLHFLAWYRHQTAHGDGPTLAIRHCFQHCGRAMIETTMICGLGMLAFGMSEFMPTRRFAILMFTLLNVALIADLIFLPAILASPLGRVFSVPKGAVEAESGVLLIPEESSIYLGTNLDDLLASPEE